MNNTKHVIGDHDNVNVGSYLNNNSVVQTTSLNWEFVFPKVSDDFISVRINSYTNEYI